MAAVKEVSRDLSQAGHSVTVYHLRTNGFRYFGVVYNPRPLPPVYRYVMTHDRAMDLRARFLCDGNSTQNPGQEVTR